MSNSLTLKQVIARIERLALSHKQINHFFIGSIDEFLDNKDVTYPALFCELKNGAISKSQRLTTYNFSLYFLDLLDTASNSLQNEFEVKSDMVSVAQDFMAMLGFTDYQADWDIATDVNMNILDYQLQDLCAGVSLDVAVSTRFDSNRCQVPASDVTFEYDNTDMKIIYNYIYTNDNGVEDVTIGTLANKYIVLLMEGIQPLIPITTGTPNADQYKYTAATGKFEFGTYVKSLQILYRNI